jgi:hypothetical protein
VFSVVCRRAARLLPLCLQSQSITIRVVLLQVCIGACWRQEAHHQPTLVGVISVDLRQGHRRGGPAAHHIPPPAQSRRNRGRG